MLSTTRLLTWGAFPWACILFVAVGAATGQPQIIGGETGPFFDDRETVPLIDLRASTVFEGHARGLSELIRARAAYNLTTAEALKKLTEATREQIRNREDWTHTYFQLREANRAYRAKEEGPRPTAEDIVRYAQMGKPNRLSPGDIDSISGTIAWPEVLMANEFAAERKQLERLFADWIHYGSISFEHRRQIRDTTESMRYKLQDRIEELPPTDYVTARRFLESLAYEAYLAAS